MTQHPQLNKINMLNTIKCALHGADCRLSWDQLPSRHSIQNALKFTNTLLAMETNKQTKTQHEHDRSNTEYNKQID